MGKNSVLRNGWELKLANRVQEVPGILAELLIILAVGALTE